MASSGIFGIIVILLLINLTTYVLLRLSNNLHVDIKYNRKRKIKIFSLIINLIYIFLIFSSFFIFNNLNPIVWFYFFFS